LLSLKGVRRWAVSVGGIAAGNAPAGAKSLSSLVLWLAAFAASELPASETPRLGSPL
jgi:hypothetical protein